MEESTPELDCNVEEVEAHSDCECYLLKSVVKDENVVRSLASEVKSLPFTPRANDLHTLSQTEDFSDIKVLPSLIAKFVHIMKTQVRKFVEEAFDVKTSSKMTMTGSEYNKGDYLLCHDDLYSDRLVAFVFYLSENWTESDGGLLRFFEYNEDEPISDKYLNTFVPLFNSLLIFRVSEHSFHEVQEVFGDKSRLSINGWFHGPKALEKQRSNFMKAPFMTFTEYISDDISKEVIQPQYLKNTIIQDLGCELHKNLVVLGSNFLTDTICEATLKELQATKKWELKGSPMYRKYEALEIDFDNSKIVLPEDMPNVNKLVDFLVSQYWQMYLNDITGLEFAVLSDTCVPPVCAVEIQKWREGSYSIVTDNNALQQTPTIEVIAFLEVSQDVINDRTHDSPSYNGCLVRLFSRKFSKNTYKRLCSVKYQKVLADTAHKYKRISTFAPHLKFGKNLKHLNHCLSNEKAIGIKKENHRQKLQRLDTYLERMKKNIQRKVTRIEQYRKDIPQESNFIVPKSNSVLIAMNSHNTGLFTSYIRHSSYPGNSGPKTCMYCINITYLVTSSCLP